MHPAEHSAATSYYRSLWPSLSSCRWSTCKTFQFASEASLTLRIYFLPIENTIPPDTGPGDLYDVPTEILLLASAAVPKYSPTPSCTLRLGSAATIFQFVYSKDIDVNYTTSSLVMFAFYLKFFSLIWALGWVPYKHRLFNPAASESVGSLEPPLRGLLMSVLAYLLNLRLEDTVPMDHCGKRPHCVGHADRVWNGCLIWLNSKDTLPN